MMDQFNLEREFFVVLEQLDEAIGQQVAAEGCRRCGGPLHRGDYERKPRGALIAPSGEAFVWRVSLCCGREGCRKRATPPSMRFLGRRVYLGAVVIVASMVAQARATLGALRRATGVPPRTVRRWLGWWQGPFLTTEVFLAVRARLVGVDIEQLPTAILGRFEGTWTWRMQALLALLAPLTTGSVPNGSRFVRSRK